jgi:hypothetical protein
VCHVPYPAGEEVRAAWRSLNRCEYRRRNRVMQTAEGGGDGIFLRPGDRARAERLTWHFGHDDQGRVRV